MALPGGQGPQTPLKFVLPNKSFADAIDEIPLPFDDPYWEIESSEFNGDVACFDWYSDSPRGNDAQPQINNSFLGYNYEEPWEAEAALFPDYWAQPPPADVQSDQVVVIDSDEQQEDEEPLDGFFDAPLGVVVLTDPVPVEDASSQLEDFDEPFGFEDSPLSDDVINQLHFVPLGFDYEDPDFPQDFADAPQSGPVQSDQVFVNDASTQLEDFDEPDNFFEGPRPLDVTADPNQLYFVPLQYDFNDPDEPENFSEAPISGDFSQVPNQLFFNPLQYDYDVEDLKDLGFEFPGVPLDATVESNQVFVEDSYLQLEDFDEPENFFLAPLSPDPPIQEQDRDESSDEQNLDEEEDFGFVLEPLPQDVHNQIIVVMAGNNYDDQEHYEGFFEGPLASEPVVESTQVFVEDAYLQLEDFDEPENFIESPLVPDAIVQSNQVFVEDASWIQEDEQEPQDFFDSPALPNVLISSQIFFVSSNYDYEDKETYEGFSDAPAIPELVIESDQVFVEDGSNFDVEADVEDFAFSDSPAVPELVIESDQVFVTDSFEQPEDHDDLEQFFDLQTPEDNILPPIPPLPIPDIFSGGWEPKRRTKEDVRKSRIEYGVLKEEKTKPVIAPEAYFEQSAKVAQAIAKTRQESIALKSRIAAIEADIQAERIKRTRKERAKLEHELLLAQQQLTLLTVQEAVLIEEMEVLDIAFFVLLGLIL